MRHFVAFLIDKLFRVCYNQNVEIYIYSFIESLLEKSFFEKRYEMISKIDETIREQSIEAMTNNMVVLRTMLNLSQAELANLIGVGRQTLAAVENRKRKMTWSVFLSLMFVFSQNKQTNTLLTHLGVYSDILKSIYHGYNENN